jgi:hypothetical protein
VWTADFPRLAHFVLLGVLFMRALALPPGCDRLLVRPWPDPVIDDLGHDPRSPYVERFWLSILGPSSTWFLRHVVERFDEAPHGFDLDLAECAAAIGLGSRQSRTAAFPRTVSRCCQFGTARLVKPTTLEVRRRLAPLTRRQANRLPDPLRREHALWAEGAPGGSPSGSAATPAVLADKARRLALSLLELGEDADGAEQQLQRWRFPQLIAREATAWAMGRWNARLEAGASQA